VMRRREQRFARMQILTIEELPAGEGIDCPYLRHGTATFRRAPRDRGPEARTGQMDFEGDGNGDDRAGA